VRVPWPNSSVDCLYSKKLFRVQPEWVKVVNSVAGRWYSSLAELIWCLDALLDPAVSGRFGAQGRRFAQAESGSKAAFVDRVHMAIGDRLVLANR
jgi:hypothetical protein